MIVHPLRCDACGRELPREERGRWVTVVREDRSVALLCPGCRQGEIDAERAKQREPKYSEPPPVWRGWGR